jgi:hypothetical protein
LNTFKNGDLFYDRGMIYVVEGSDVQIYSNVIEDNTGSLANGVCIDNSDPLVLHSTVYNYDEDPWREFNSPQASVAFVEHNTDGSFNNTYSNNGTDEGNDIRFYKTGDVPEQTGEGTMVSAPATHTGTTAFTITATYTFVGFSSEGTLTLMVDPGFTLTTASRVKIGDFPERNLVASEISGQTVNLSGITGENVQVVFTIEQTSTLILHIYLLSVEVDRDGGDTLYSPSSGVSTNINIG